MRSFIKARMGVTAIRNLAALGVVGVLILGFQNCGAGITVQEASSSGSFTSPSLGSESDAGGGSAPPLPSATTTPPPMNSRIYLPGVNLAGGEINLGKVGARLFYDYVYPNTAEMDYFAEKGMKIIRIPFDLNRIQPQRNGALDSTELSLLSQAVNEGGKRGLKVLLDPHNYGYMKDAAGADQLIGVHASTTNAMFADFWRRMALEFKNRDFVYFGLMNEPFQQTAAQWKASAVAAVNAIRSTGANNKVMVQGTAWSGAHSWISSGNAAAWAGFKDINFAIEVHQYLDHDSSGTNQECTAGTSDAVKNVTAWARSEKMDLFLGEIGWTTTSLCMSEGDKLMSYMKAHSDVWLGYTYWTAGAWYEEYYFTIGPRGLGTNTVTDRPQLSVLQAHF